ncbi:MAG: TerB family tellurite resistance protein [Alphaproteobacteria bacterium]|nr:TerB family tellurite resistance protein [Alphaproteobacteria bacterium]
MLTKISPTLWNKILWAIAIISIAIGAQMGNWFWGLLIGIGIVLYLQNKFGEDIQSANRITTELRVGTTSTPTNIGEKKDEPAKIQRNNEDLVALMFIARADGKFTDKEKQVIRKHLLRDCKEEDAKTILRALYKMNPSRERFKDALKSLASRTDKERQIIYDTVIEMSDHLNKRNEITESAISLALNELGSKNGRE